MTAGGTVILGSIVGVYGIRGWLRIRSETEPMTAILGYRPWLLGPDQQTAEVVEGRAQGKGLVVHLQGCEDRDHAMTLVGQDIAVPRAALPEPEEGEYYWTDIEGLRVVTVTGEALGVVSHLFATGANDVMVVRGEDEYLLPFVWEQVVREVDQASGTIVVDWDTDY